MKSIKKIIKPLRSIILPHNYYSNKHVLITGGGSGLGKQIAYTYSSLGAEVSILGRKVEKLKETKNVIEKLTKKKINYHSLDVRNFDSLNELAEDMKESNKLPDIIINNAAGNILSPIKNLSPNAINSVIDIVLKGTLNTTLAFGKQLIESELPGSFVNISTTYAKTGSSFVIPSSVAKAGCDNLTKSLASEWGKYGIRINSVAPGPIYTEGAFSRLDPENKFSDLSKSKLPLGRFGEKEEIANLVSYLTSEHNNWMTGQIINFDGGEVVGNAGEFNALHYLSDDDWLNLRK